MMIDPIVVVIVANAKALTCALSNRPSLPAPTTPTTSDLSGRYFPAVEG